MASGVAKEVREVFTQYNTHSRVVVTGCGCASSASAPMAQHTEQQRAEARQSWTRLDDLAPPKVAAYQPLPEPLKQAARR